MKEIKKQDFYDLFDYLFWIGRFPFSKVPMNELDGAIFAIFTYIDLRLLFSPTDSKDKCPKKSSFSVKEVANWAAKEMDIEKISSQSEFDKKYIDLLFSMSKTIRYASIRVSDYIWELDPLLEKQFCALTFKIPKIGGVLAFRGTDDNLVSWKENFNMSFMSSVPSQEDALHYLIHYAKRHTGYFYSCGHSKGGNLAAFAALHLPQKYRHRLAKVYSYDGPGFGFDVIESKQYKKIQGKIVTFVPQSSIVGMLLHHSEPFHVVPSSLSGIFQHDPFSWKVEGLHFGRLDEVSQKSRRISTLFRHWIINTEKEEAEIFIDTIYDLLIETKAKTVTQLIAEGGRLPLKILKSLRKLSPDKRHLILKMMAGFLSAYRAALNPNETSVATDCIQTEELLSNSLTKTEKEKNL